MERVVVFYFSGTGNTRFCALALGDALAERSIPSRILSIENSEAMRAAQDLGSEDLPIFAYPIYGSDFPLPMRDFLRHFPSWEKQKGAALRDAAVFCTQLAFSGDGAAVADEELLPRGYKARWTAHIPMPNNIAIQGFPLGWTNDPAKLARARNRASFLLSEFAAALVEGREFRKGRSFISRPLGLLQRLPYRSVMEKHRNRVSVDLARCTHCGLCTRLCPVGNLPLSSLGPQAAGRCVLCLRCYSFCPQLAIRFYGKGPNPRKGPPYLGPEPGFDPRILRKEDAVRGV